MAPDDRRAMIVEASIPLIRTHGAEVTARQIAQAAGIAEGTVFRAFADKDAILDAAIARVLDPTDVLEALDAIERGLPLEDTLQQIATLLHGRVRDVVAVMAALGPREHARLHEGSHERHGPPLEETTAVVEELLAPHASELRVPVSAAGDYLRLLAFGTAMPFVRADTATDPAALADLILCGIAARAE